MKKLSIYMVVGLSIAFYACMPLVVIVNADSSPFLTPTLNGNATDASTLAVNDPALAAAADPILRMRVTAYASVPDETDSTPFITANGTHVYYGEAASNILPFGTKIEIPTLFGNQIFTIEDRMSPRIKNTIDIWMPSVNDAIDFGMSHADIVILDEPSSTDNVAFAS